MTKFVNLLGRRNPAAGNAPGPAPEAAPAPAAATEAPIPPAAVERNVIELDQELFFPIATQLGEDNETVRNLLIDAEHKLSELETIRRSIGKLVDPVSKTLRAFEETKSQKIALQTQLNNTRAAFLKQRDELEAATARLASLESERTELRELVTGSQQRTSALEGANAQLTNELNTRRAQVVDLQRVVQQLTGDLQTARDDNKRLSERVVSAEKRMVQLEADSAGVRQKLSLAEQEKTTLDGLLQKSVADSAELSRKLTDTERLLSNTQRRLSQLETGFGEIQTERAKLAATLDETTEKYNAYVISQNARYEALQARAALSEKLLEDSRLALASRADEIAAFERRFAEANMARGSAEARLAEIERAVLDRDATIKELEKSRAALAEQNEALTSSIATREQTYNRSQEKLFAQQEALKLMESQLGAARQQTELRIEELKAELQRERLERTMAEGALEAGRKDIARLLRELSASHHRAPAQANDAANPARPPRVASAA